MVFFVSSVGGEGKPDGTRIGSAPTLLLLNIQSSLNIGAEWGILVSKSFVFSVSDLTTNTSVGRASGRGENSFL